MNAAVARSTLEFNQEAADTVNALAQKKGTSKSDRKRQGGEICGDVRDVLIRYGIGPKGRHAAVSAEA
jgi:hypothetical protein